MLRQYFYYMTAFSLNCYYTQFIICISVNVHLVLHFNMNLKVVGLDSLLVVQPLTDPKARLLTLMNPKVMFITVRVYERDLTQVSNSSSQYTMCKINVLKLLLKLFVK